MNELLTLGGWLTKAKVDSAYTYSRKERTAGVTLGLGWFPSNIKGMPKASLTPHGPMKLMLNQVEDEIASAVYSNFRTHPEDWALRTVLSQGWVTTLEDKKLNEAKAFHLGHLYPKFTLEEVCFLEFSNIENSFEEWIATLRASQQEIGLSYSEAGRLIRLGLSPEEFQEAAKLPFHIAEEMFS